MTFTVIIIVALFAGGIIWIAMNMPHLIGFTATLLDWCQGLLESCLSIMPVIKAGVIWVVIITIATGFIYASLMALWRLHKSSKAIKRLPVSYRDGIRLIKDDTLNTAFTHGLIFPKIYVSTGLLKRLSREEVHAVILHEIHHRDVRDPLRFFLLAILKDAFFYLPIGSYIKAKIMHLRERAADDQAVRVTDAPYVLASALLKVADYRGAAVGIKGNNNNGSIEGRIRRLIGEEEAVFKAPSMRTLIVSLLITAILLIGAVLPISTATADSVKCDMSHCTKHERPNHREVTPEGVMSEKCMAHCDMKH